MQNNNLNLTNDKTTLPPIYKRTIKAYIYALVDPRRPEIIRYVGQAECPRTRQIQHCQDAGPSEKCEWIESMRMDGVLPQMLILKEIFGEQKEVNAAERYFIELHHANLTNTNGKPKFQRKVIESRKINLVEQAHIESVLAKCHGCKQEAARQLGIGRQTLYNKLAQFEHRKKV